MKCQLKNKWIINYLGKIEEKTTSEKIRFLFLLLIQQFNIIELTNDKINHKTIWKTIMTYKFNLIN